MSGQSCQSHWKDEVTEVIEDSDTKFIVEDEKSKGKEDIDSLYNNEPCAISIIRLSLLTISLIE